MWDLTYYGRPVETLEDLLGWLAVKSDLVARQRTAVIAWLSVNRREIPEALRGEINAWLQEENGIYGA